MSPINEAVKSILCDGSHQWSFDETGTTRLSFSKDGTGEVRTLLGVDQTFLTRRF